MVTWDGLDRRKFPRCSYPCLIVIHDDEKSEDRILSHTENIGIGGVCVIIKKNIKIFSPVEIELDLLDLEDHVKCKGKVVWSVRRKLEDKKKPMFYDVGIEFDNISSKDQVRIDSVIKKLVENSDEVPRS